MEGTFRSPREGGPRSCSANGAFPDQWGMLVRARGIGQRGGRMVRWVGLSLALAVTRLGAQNAEPSPGVPDADRPPPGMCRIWIDGVPPDRQPAPTDCATAVRRRPSNARVVFGDLSTYVAPTGSLLPNSATGMPAAQPGAPAAGSASGSPASSPTSAPPARESAPEPARPDPKPAASQSNAPARPPMQVDPRLAPLPNHATPMRPQPARPVTAPPTATPPRPAAPTQPIAPPMQKPSPPAGRPPQHAFGRSSR